MYPDFMSPYTTGVIEQVEKDIERQGNVARQRAAAQAVGRGAFGGLARYSSRRS